jgi:hypothetical protein
MATPHTAGIAALVVAGHRGWNVGQVKAAVMNTAAHDVYSEPHHRGLRYGPARVGAGRVDAEYATSTTVVAYALGQGEVSASFGLVEAPATAPTVVRRKRVRVRNTARATTTVDLDYDPLVEEPGVRYAVSPRRVRVRGGGSTDVTVSMTVVTADLRRTLDPTMSPTTTRSLTGSAGPRQFVPDASGHLLVTPARRTPLRVPVYGAAKPVSETTARPVSVGGQRGLALTGRGVDQGSGSTAFQSKVSVLALGATSRRLPPCAVLQTSGCVANASTRSADLRYVGAGAVTPDGADPAQQGILWFGLATWGRGVLQGAWEAEVAVDTNGDDEADFYVDGYTPPGSDQPVSLLLDGKGAGISANHANFYAGDTDTNAYDNDVTLLPVDVADLKLSASASTLPIRYSVTTFSPYGESGGFDRTPWIDFDVAHPAIRTASPLFVDTGDQTLRYSTPPAAVGAGLGTRPGRRRITAAADTVSALVLHLGGPTGRRAEVVPLPGS